jgi:hypothetical protein
VEVVGLELVLIVVNMEITDEEVVVVIPDEEVSYETLVKVLVLDVVDDDVSVAVGDPMVELEAPEEEVCVELELVPEDDPESPEEVVLADDDE